MNRIFLKLKEIEIGYLIGIIFILSLLFFWESMGSTASTCKGTDELMMFPSTEGAQSLSMMIRTERGKLIIIDGGWDSDAEMLKEKIQTYGGVVDAWLLTHPHADHAGALLQILQEGNSDIEIKKIYESFADLEWYQTYAPDDPGITAALLDCFKQLPQGTVDDRIGRGTIIRVDDVSIEVMNDRGEITENAVNNSCIVYKLTVKGKSVMILGDLAYEGGEQLLQDVGAEALKSDVVQMAHHGQEGVGKDVYAAISPEVCLWPTPQWLWDNDNGGGPGSGPWSTLETRTWMQELHVQKNRCTKDGDIYMCFQ
ncbi:MAG: MBL fold metallo-hydrolase [Eubacteriales bacterium]|nr:MBL fold metallo-hydrolase [Eubacteriales bacterium]